MSLRRLSGVDTAFLTAEQPGQLLHMMGLLVLDPSSAAGGWSFERFAGFVEERLPALPPLRRRLVEVPFGLARPFWSEGSEVDLADHLHRAALPEPGGPRELAALAAEIHERPLDRSRPLWEMTLVEGLAGGRVALLAKIHHACMDGLAGIKLMASLFSSTPEIAPAAPADAEPGEPPPDRLALLAGAVPWLLGEPARAARAGLGTARSALRAALSRKPAPEAPELDVPRSLFNAPISAYRGVAYASLPLAELRALGRAAEVTVNDVLLTLVGGALRRYLEDRGALPPEPLVVGMPVAVRRETDERANAVTMVSVGLATDVADPVARLDAIRAATAVQKRRRGSTLGEELTAWVDVPPPFVFSLLARGYIGSGLADRMDPFWNLVVSSVPGPPEPLYLAGARLEGIHPLGPIFAGMALNVTAIGCGASLDLGLVACRRRVPDLWELADAIPGALAELGAALAGERRAESGRA
jgi:diacylglycerol O-acyltransferase